METRVNNYTLYEYSFLNCIYYSKDKIKVAVKLNK